MPDGDKMELMDNQENKALWGNEDQRVLMECLDFLDCP